MNSITKYFGYINAMYDEVIKTYEDNKNIIITCEGERTDLLHEIEMAKPKGTVNGYKLYKQLHDVLEKRRQAKDENEILEELYNFICSRPDFRTSIKRIQSNTQIKINKQKLKFYKPRVRNDLTITKEPVRKIDDLVKKFNTQEAERKKCKWL